MKNILYLFLLSTFGFCAKEVAAQCACDLNGGKMVNGALVKAPITTNTDITNPNGQAPVIADPNNTLLPITIDANTNTNTIGQTHSNLSKIYLSSCLKMTI